MKKKLLALLLSLCLTAGLLAACGGSDDPAPTPPATDSGSTTTTTTDDTGGGDDPAPPPTGGDHPMSDVEYTLKIAVTAWDSQADQQAVMDALGDRLTEMGYPGLGVEVVGFSWTDFDGGAMSTYILSGEDYDLTWAADWANFRGEALNAGGFQPWDPYLQQVPEYWEMLAPYAEDIKMTAGPDAVEGIWAVPTFKEFASALCAIRFNKTVSDALGITDDLYNIKHLDELDPYLQMFVDAYPNGIAAIPGTALMAFYNESDNGNPYHPIYNPFSDNYTTGVFQPWYKQYTDKTREWREKGFTPEWAITEEYDNLFRMNGPESFLVSFSTGKPGGEAELNTWGDSFEWGEVIISKPFLTVGSILGNPYYINVHSQNPEAATFIYMLLCTDFTLNNLLLFGIEGTHYNLNAAGQVERIDGSGYAPNVLAFIGNRMLCLPLPGEPADIQAAYEEFNASAIRLGNYGFPWPDAALYDPDFNQDAFWGVHGALWDQYGSRADFGFVDEADIAEMARQLEAVEYERFDAIFNAAFDDFRAGN